MSNERRGLLKLNGSLSIGRISGGSETSEDHPIRIELIDELSHCRIIDIRLSLANFTEALMGRGCTPCLVEFNDTGTIGMRAENKTELVRFDMYGGGKSDQERIKKALKPFEVDGWRARYSDMTNGHCSVTKDKERYQRVVFFRHVPTEDTASDAAKPA